MYDTDALDEALSLEDVDADEATVPAPPTEPVLPEPENFDLDSWINGVQSTLRSCNIYQRSDLIATIEELEGRLKVAQAAARDEDASLEDTPDDPAALDAQLAQAYEDFVASGITFRVRGLSRAANDRIKAQVLKRKGPAKLSGTEKNALVTRHQVAAAIVHPEGVTADHLAVLEEANGAQYRRLCATFIAACVQAPQPTVPSSPAR